MVQDAVVSDVPLVYEVTLWYWHSAVEPSTNPKWWDRFIDNMSGTPVEEVSNIIRESFGSFTEIPIEKGVLRRFELRFNDHAALTLFILKYT